MTPHDAYSARYSADPADPSQAERLAAYSAGWGDRARTAASCAAGDAATVAATLESYNRWRRGNADGLEQPHPHAIGEAIDRAVAMLSADVSEVSAPSDAQLDQALCERDTYHEWADKLSEKIAHLTGADVGEHSSANNPWREALNADVPEGCTPADARVLREANHALAIEVHELREALSTPLAAVAKADMVMVPREPTEAMVRACMRNDQGGLMTPEYRKAVYRAMVAAATSHPTPKE
jgi:hypothetical protein